MVEGTDGVGRGVMSFFGEDGGDGASRSWW